MHSLAMISVGLLLLVVAQRITAFSIDDLDMARAAMLSIEKNMTALAERRRSTRTGKKETKHFFRLRKLKLMQA